MKAFKNMKRYVCSIYKSSLSNISVYVVLLTLFLVVQYCCPGIGRYLKETGDRANLWELYIWSMSTRQSQLIYLVGVIGMACQVVGWHGGMDLHLIRMDRHRWIRSQAWTLFFHVIGVNVFMILCSVIACKGQITFRGEWSSASFIAAQYRYSGVIGLREIFFVSHNLLRFDPNVLGLISFALASLLGISMGLIMMIFMLLKKTIFGGMVIVLLWFMDVLAKGIPAFGFLQYILPLFFPPLD